jgi:hypothetical protein
MMDAAIWTGGEKRLKGRNSAHEMGKEFYRKKPSKTNSKSGTNLRGRSVWFEVADGNDNWGSWDPLIEGGMDLIAFPQAHSVLS